MEYESFVRSKIVTDVAVGFEAKDIGKHLFDFQAHIVEWACRRGRAAIFADTGLGKTAMQVEWARQVAAKTYGKVIIFAPLCVAQQTVHEAAKFGTSVQYCRSQSEMKGNIIITNYEMIDHFDLTIFSGVVLDESSILKSYMGKTKRALVDACETIHYKLAKEKDEERHICPLQLGVIERSIELWSNPNDLVFSPFTGIGSEGYIARKMGRRFVGAELKKSYFEIACRNLAESTYMPQDDLFAA